MDLNYSLLGLNVQPYGYSPGTTKPQVVPLHTNETF